MRTCLRTAATAFLLALSLSAYALFAEELTSPLTAGQVSCNEGQLDRLLARITTTGVTEDVNAAAPAFTTIASYSSSSGFYEGIALTSGFARTSAGEPPAGSAESYLSWNVNPTLRALLLNPARQPLGQVQLAREETGTNVAAPGNLGELVLTLDPTLAAAKGPGLLTINNFSIPPPGAPYDGFLMASAAPGRGLTVDGLLTPCHTLFASQDRRIFALLERMVRVEAVKGISFVDVKVSVFRGEDPHLYRIDASLLDPVHGAQGKVAASLVVNWTSTGALTTGVLSMLSACAASDTTGCSAPAIPAVVLIVPPVLGGSQSWSGDPRVRSVSFDPTTGPSTPAAIDFAALLRDTAWND